MTLQAPFALQAPVALLARLLLALIFVVEGWGKLFNYSGTLQYMDHHGVPGILLPLVILTELGGGLLVAFGFLTRVAAFALAGFCVLTALLFHGRLSDPGELIQFYKDVAMAGGFLALVAFGAGDWSVDGLARSAELSDMPTGEAREQRG
ncbi:DoxX family protein [Microvirga sp. TS319]|uniref:DoxX family protein n=1 Tax=Microvirga sp. TS319 TaxID=3241165 RepID=UPI00351A4DC2